MSVLIVTGTSTDVGKTVATAALATCATGRVAVVKPAQTGTGDGTPGDLYEVTRLSGVREVHEFARYPDPLSPHHAARLSGLPELVLGETVRRIVDLDAEYDGPDDLVLVEGAGGLLVPFCGDAFSAGAGIDPTADSGVSWTIADLAASLHAPVVLVTTPGLGTLNHTSLTVERLAEDGIALAAIVLGTWPHAPDLAMRCNLDDLAALAPDHTLAGVLPAGMATVGDFSTAAHAALAPRFGGTFDWSAFRAANTA